MNDTNLEIIIGLEIHAQISSKTKLFCSCDNDSFQKEPNTNICPICMGFPGMLPVVNELAVKKGAMAALALNCKVNAQSKFDRKSYFYPDLPSGFQISQYEKPISEQGHLMIETTEGPRKIGITRLHLENDAGKLTHTSAGTLIDFNRAGTPLMEIVTEPDLRSAEEAVQLAEEIRKILRFAGSSDCDMEKGMMRFDASVSLREKGTETLNPRAEIKNLNSFRSLKAAILHESARQKELWNAGTPLAREETVGWDEERQVTVLLREKESAADYRYFSEPDLPPIVLTEEEILNLKASLPELPSAKYQRFIKEYGLSESDAKFYTDHLELALYFEQVANMSKQAALAHSFVGTILVSRLRESDQEIHESKVSPEAMAELLICISEGLISNNQAKTEVLNAMLESGKSAKTLIAELGLSQVSNQDELKSYCEKAIQELPQAANDVREGREKALAALVGSVMKQSKGKANPQIVNQIFKELLK